MAKLKIREIKTDKLKEYENNPRFNDKAVESVQNSLQKFGFTNPVLINKDHVILAGHTRVKAAKKAGLEVVPCIILDHLSEDEEKAFRIIDNRAAEFSAWDKDMLNAEMQSVTADDWADFGFRTREIVKEGYTCPRCGAQIIDE